MMRSKNSSPVVLICTIILACIVIVAWSNRGQATSRVGWERGIVKNTPAGPHALRTPVRLAYLDPARYLNELGTDRPELAAPIPRIGVSKGSTSMFNPNQVSISTTSTGTIDISASVDCPDPNCLRDGDYVMVEIIKDDVTGNFSYRPDNKKENSQTQTLPLKLGNAVTASFKVTPNKGTPTGEYNFTIRVADVRRGNDSILENVTLDPKAGGVQDRLTVTQ